MIIVVGYIPTPEGRAALTAAIDVAQLQRATVLVVNASRGDAPVDPRFSSDEEWAQVRRTLAESGLEFRLLQLLQATEPADQVLEAAREHSADLIVLGLRRRSPVGKLLLGSSAQRILLEADCPVYAVKAPTLPEP
ncbi:MAG: universal stress protein [Kineosporiaceae bacterium]|nr:universal stress protein [Kineosporiaceae bacterium]MBK7623570.1 universal stress protein [Kineosporiaceae bacterium]MBK8077914.1 universal stress protein [Kineosporiaceae bacterium]